MTCSTERARKARTARRNLAAATAEMSDPVLAIFEPARRQFQLIGQYPTAGRGPIIRQFAGSESLNYS